MRMTKSVTIDQERLLEERDGLRMQLSGTGERVISLEAELAQARARLEAERARRRTLELETAAARGELERMSAQLAERTRQQDQLFEERDGLRLQSSQAAQRLISVDTALAS